MKRSGLIWWPRSWGWQNLQLRDGLWEINVKRPFKRNPTVAPDSRARVAGRMTSCTRRSSWRNQNKRPTDSRSTNERETVARVTGSSQFFHLNYERYICHKFLEIAPKHLTIQVKFVSTSEVQCINSPTSRDSRRHRVQLKVARARYPFCSCQAVCDLFHQYFRCTQGNEPFPWHHHTAILVSGSMAVAMSRILTYLSNHESVTIRAVVPVACMTCVASAFNCLF